MKLKPHQRVDYKTAVTRALECMYEAHEPMPASWVGMYIWLGNQMKAQGLGAAASRILSKMKKEGLVTWTHTARRWGYVLTSKGRVAHQKASYHA